MSAPDAFEADLDALRGLNGIFLGLLSPAEIEAFDRLCENSLARRAYIGAAGFMSLAKVELLERLPDRGAQRHAFRSAT